MTEGGTGLIGGWGVVGIELCFGNVNFKMCIKHINGRYM